MGYENLEFTLERQERPVTIDGDEYVLVELDGRERDKYLNNLAPRMKTNAKGKPAGLKSFDGLQAWLIHLSLFKVEGDARKPVSVETIQTWPARVIKGIFDASKELSALDDDDDEDEEGNDLEASD